MMHSCVCAKTSLRCASMIHWFASSPKYLCSLGRHCSHWLTCLGSIRTCRWILTTSSHCWAISKLTGQKQLMIRKGKLTSPRDTFHVPVNTRGSSGCGGETLTLLCCHQSHRFVSLAASEHLRPLGAHNTGVPFECLASSSVHTTVEWSDCERLALPILIGQG